MTPCRRRAAHEPADPRVALGRTRVPAVPQRPGLDEGLPAGRAWRGRRPSRLPPRRRRIRADGLSAELPTVSGEATPAPATTAGTVPDSTSQPVASSGKVRIRTDVLDVDASLAGAELVRADILQYPQHKDDPKTPVRLFNTDSPDTQFLFQSGLTTGEAGRTEPNHKAVFTSGAAEYRPGRRRRRARGAVHLVGRRGPHGDEDVRLPPRLVPRGPALPGRERGRRAGQARVLCAVPAPLARQQALDVGPGDLCVPRARVLRRQRLPEARHRGFEDDQSLSLPVTDGWIAAMQHHFVAAAVPAPKQAYQYELRVEDMDYLLRAVGPAHVVPAGGSAEFAETLFVGTEAAGPAEGGRPAARAHRRLRHADDPRAAAVQAAVLDLRLRRQLGLDDHHRHVPDQARLLQAVRDERPLDGEDEDDRAAPQGAAGAPQGRPPGAGERDDGAVQDARRSTRSPAACRSWCRSRSSSRSTGCCSRASRCARRRSWAGSRTCRRATRTSCCRS